MKKVKNITGYMLGNKNDIHQLGAAWKSVDSKVWICSSLAKAKRVLEDSQQFSAMPHCVWTTIYQVSAKDIALEYSDDGLMYTNTPTKLSVDRVVYYKEQKAVQKSLSALLRELKQENQK
jgi:hypothetical protein